MHPFAKRSVDPFAVVPDARPIDRRRCLSGLAAGAAVFVAGRRGLSAAPSPPPDIAAVKTRGSAERGAVFDLGAAGRFDAAWTTCPSVVRVGPRYLMWYSSVFDSKQGQGGIGVAESTDGAVWRRLNDGKPVLKIADPGRFDDGQLLSPEVKFDGRLFRMWYTGMASLWHPSGFGFYRIGLATSVDGIRWQRAAGGRPVFDVGLADSPDEVQAATPTILRDGNGYRMWYAAWSPRHNHTICAARSDDGLQWRRENDGLPITGLSPSIAFAPAVTRLGDRLLLVYQALQAKPGLYAAVSDDGLAWTMCREGRPIVEPGGPEDFDAGLVGHPTFIPGEEENGGTVRKRMLYIGYRSEPVGVAGRKVRIGQATLECKP
jgi:hypothetical protein